MAKEIKKLTTPLTDECLAELKCGDPISLSGIIYTGRDLAHKKMVDLLAEGKELPFDLQGQVIYYVGPTPPKPGQVIGSAGPTTSYRMDAYSPILIKAGLKGMIGKGKRGDEVMDAMKNHKAVYFAAVGGAGALIAKSIKSAKVIAWEELGAEAVRELVVEDFPMVVINDIYGGDCYKEGRKQYEVKA